MTSFRILNFEFSILNSHPFSPVKPEALAADNPPYLLLDFIPTHPETEVVGGN